VSVLDCGVFDDEAPLIATHSPSYIYKARARTTSPLPPLPPTHAPPPTRESDDDTLAFIQNLRNGTYKALVLDAPVTAYLVATMNDQCDLFAVGEPFETFDIAISFPPDAPDQMVADVSRWVVRLQVGGWGGAWGGVYVACSACWEPVYTAVFRAAECALHSACQLLPSHPHYPY